MPCSLKAHTYLQCLSCNFKVAQCDKETQIWLMLPRAQLKTGDVCSSCTQFVPLCDAIKLQIRTFSLTKACSLHKLWEGSVWCLGLVPRGSAGNSPDKQRGATTLRAHHQRGQRYWGHIYWTAGKYRAGHQFWGGYVCMCVCVWIGRSGWGLYYNEKRQESSCSSHSAGHKFASWSPSRWRITGEDTKKKPFHEGGPC